MFQTIHAYLPLEAGRQPDGKRPIPLKSPDNLEDFRASYQKTTVRHIRRMYSFDFSKMDLELPGFKRGTFQFQTQCSTTEPT